MAVYSSRRLVKVPLIQEDYGNLFNRINANMN